MNILGRLASAFTLPFESEDDANGNDSKYIFANHYEGKPPSFIQPHISKAFIALKELEHFYAIRHAIPGEPLLRLSRYIPPANEFGGWAKKELYRQANLVGKTYLDVVYHISPEWIIPVDKNIVWDKKPRHVISSQTEYDLYQILQGFQAHHLSGNVILREDWESVAHRIYYKKHDRRAIIVFLRHIYGDWLNNWRNINWLWVEKNRTTPIIQKAFSPGVSISKSEIGLLLLHLAMARKSVPLRKRFGIDSELMNGEVYETLTQTLWEKPWKVKPDILQEIMTDDFVKRQCQKAVLLGIEGGPPLLSRWSFSVSLLWEKLCKISSLSPLLTKKPQTLDEARILLESGEWMGALESIVELVKREYDGDIWRGMEELFMGAEKIQTPISCFPIQ